VDKIKLLIVDDHPLVRHGLRRILEREKDIDVMGEAEDGQLAIDAAAQAPPDVILLDINMPNVNGLQALRQIKHANAHISIIMLTAFNNPAQLFHAMRAGASAYYPKEVAPAELLLGIRNAVEGSYIIQGKVLNEKKLNEWLFTQFSMPGAGQNAVADDYPDEMFVPLSGREMEILQQITRGLSNKEIARALGISRQTVKNHMTSILRKLKVNDRTQAALYALRHGWIRLEDTE
jgi:DNA-binding NarL/FixJ family response regulator